MKKVKLLSIVFYFFLSHLNAQGSEDNNENPFTESLKAGNMFLGVGTNLFTDVTRNQDVLDYYVIDETDRRFNLRVVWGYFIKDTNPVGIGYRYKTNKLNTTYENALTDTITYEEIRNSHVFNIFYGITKPLFDSRRIYFVSDPSIFFTAGNTKSNRTLDEITDYSRSNNYELSLGLNVGVMVFLWPNMSASATVGPIGLGYKWEIFYLNDVSNGNVQNFYIRMSPNLLNLQFTIARYF